MAVAYRDDPWVKSNHAPTGLNMTYNYRIHPDDSHLQYGPISTALRFNAESAVPDDMLGFGDELGTWVVDYGDWCAYSDCDYRLHRSLFLLILAEALADEGL